MLSYFIQCAIIIMALSLKVVFVIHDTEFVVQ